MRNHHDRLFGHVFSQPELPRRKVVFPNARTTLLPSADFALELDVVECADDSFGS
ncbi:MAG: hypothetical protein U0263_24450 [Polyangiaceae bacterium]